MIKYINGIAFLFFTLLASSCKDGGCNIVLNSVSFKTTLNPDQATPVRVTNGWSYADGGKCGIIVYNTGKQLVAYDRCVPISNTKLLVEGFEIVDKESGAKWLLMDGTPTQSSECSLKKYGVQTSGELIIISN
ncbi:MAG: hypothetical protein ACI35V_01790 [Sphingobacterium composti]|uniref:hypothetical protein n=1 Tax=Sphingobacterium composti TaxID=363260 RepID=UPI00135907B9|nr:hypothetical protein [Sphingobacterium composti Ten et al. 2007 non Yoo et al. 2007]